MAFPTIRELDLMTEEEFERAYEVLEHHRDKFDDYDAERLLKQIDDIIEEAGTFDLERTRICHYDFSHTRHWCGRASCRDA